MFNAQNHHLYTCNFSYKCSTHVEFFVQFKQKGVDVEEKNEKKACLKMANNSTSLNSTSE